MVTLKICSFHGPHICLCSPAVNGKASKVKVALLSQTAHSQLILPLDTVVLFVDFKMHTIWRKEKQEGNMQWHVVVMFWISFICHKHLQDDLYASMGASYKLQERNADFAITLSKSYLPFHHVENA